MGEGCKINFGDKSIQAFREAQNLLYIPSSEAEGKGIPLGASLVDR
jgi:hypothetical protein